MNTWKGKHGPLLIAEIGGNHEGDFEYAKKLTELAIKADVDYIKYQIYSGDTLVNPIESPVRNQHFKKFELGKEKYVELAEMCKKAGIGFMASVWNPEFVPWIDDYSDIYKIGSGDFTAIPVIDYFISLKKPILLSTGLCSMAEVIEIVDYIKAADDYYQDPNHLAILQCTSMYPIPYDDANLNVMHTYSKKLNIPVGYSDHTEGSYALEIAVAMGAEILEFHFTDEREGKEFRDHKVSLKWDEVHDLIAKIGDIKKLQGSYEKTPLPVEGDHVISFRRALYFNRDMNAGEVITDADIVTLRPNHGLDARAYHKVIGKKIIKSAKKFDRLNSDTLDAV
jgi:N-acetylneuraminate synthase/N,N'-diacetyllegionaminate synthase